MRTDVIWLTPWDGQALQELVTSSIVAGSAFHRAGHRSDKFWIAARDSMVRAFAQVPAYFFMRISNETLWKALSCDARRPEDDFLIPRQHFWPRRTLFLDARGCECILRCPRLCPVYLYVFVCVCVCMCAFMCVCMCTHTHINTRARAHTHTHTHIHTH
jgi:hypothetical protein